MIEYFITSEFDKIEIRNSDESLFFYIKIRYGFFGAGKRTLTYYNSKNQIFFILKKHPRFFSFKKTITFNALNYKGYINKKTFFSFLTFENKEVKIIPSDNSEKNSKIFLNNIFIGNIHKISVSTSKIKYRAIFEESSENNLLCLVSFCSDFNFSW